MSIYVLLLLLIILGESKIITGRLRWEDMGDTWQVLLPRTIDPVGPDSISDFASCTSVSTYEDTEALRADVDRYDAVIDRLIDLSAETLRAAENLKVVSKHGVGVDNIGVETASELGIVVCNAPGANARGVAEQAITLLLSARKRVLAADRHVREGAWDRHQFSTREVGGDTLGLLGCGSIGSTVGELAQGLGMEVIAHDPYVDPSDAPDGVEMIDERDRLFERSDALSVHVPLTEETRGAVSTEEFRLLGEGSVVVNTSRGGVVDESALADALESGLVAGAGLDTLENEPPAPDNSLLEREDVVLTPHIGGVTVESLREASRRSAESVRDVYEGRLPDHTLNADAGTFRFEE
jgi:D-3-phosphoglycerate dehydrogenase